MKVYFISLGCDKNLADTEKYMGLTIDGGHTITDDEASADVCVINSCCFINDAKEESINTIIEMGRLKSEGSLKYLILLGCLGERYSKEILEQLPEVDAILGTSYSNRLAEILTRLESGERSICMVGNIDDKCVLPTKRVAASPVHYTYLKIAEGCNKHCTYCVIPHVKGGYYSYDFNALVEEAKALKDRGINELIVIAQETTLYGSDRYGRKRLPELLRALCGIDFIDWIRVMYCYPEDIDDELITTIRDEKKICHYIDMPIQHASDSVLKRMGRLTNQEQITSIINRFRTLIPDMVIRTTLITGFPGETQEDFDILYDYVEKMKFERLGVFTYSKEEGTPAYKMDNQVPARVKTSRRNKIMSLQKKIISELHDSMIGKTFDVIVDGYKASDSIYVGRTYMDAPDIDGLVFFESDLQLMSGSIVKIRITGTSAYDFVGVMAE